MRSEKNFLRSFLNQIYPYNFPGYWSIVANTKKMSVNSAITNF